MSKAANPRRIGLFVIGALALAVAAVILFGSGRLFQETTRYVAFFSGSLAGLSPGAPVTFRGITVGGVTEVRVQLVAEDLSSRIPVYLEILPDRFEVIGARLGSKEDRAKALIDAGLRAQLVSQSLVTGQTAIELDFRPDTPVRLTGADPDTIEIPTIPSRVEQFLSDIEQLRLDRLVATASNILARLDEILSAPELAALAPALLQLTEDGGRLVATLDESVGTVVSDFGGVADSLDQVLQQSQETIAEVNTSVPPALEDLRRLARTLDAEVPKTLALVNEMVAAAGQTAEPNSALVRDLRDATEQFSRAARSVRELADMLKRNPSALIRGN